MSRTLYEKIWDAHVVAQGPGGRTLLYVAKDPVTLLGDESTQPAG